MLEKTDVKSETRTIGVLGGMGPYATLDFLRLILDLTGADKDWDHIRVIVDNNPKIPSRTRAYLFGETDPVPKMSNGIRNLIKAGADFVVVPCNSAHYFLGRVFDDIKVPFVDMVESTAKEVLGRGWTKVGLLAGEVTVGAGLYEKILNPKGVEVIQVNGDEQILVRSVIEDVKKCEITAQTKQVMGKLFGSLTSRGAQSILLGCTELQAVVNGLNPGVPIVDSLEILARESIKEARRC